MSPLELLGIGSALLTLSAFIANEYGWLSNDDFLYDFINLISGSGLFFYAYLSGVVPFMITNSVWALVSGIDVVKHLLKRLKK